jgi:branched-chain amino acid transport system substrate-binding protein
VAAPGTRVATPGAVAPAPAGSAAVTTRAPAAPAATASRAATCSPSAAPLNLGQIGSFGGVAGPLTVSTRTAVAIWARYVNDHGGLACHPVNLYAVDDGGDPSRAAALVGELVAQHHVQALVGVISFGLAGIIPAIEREKLPVVGGDLVAPQWFAHPLLFPQGAGLNAIVDGAVAQVVNDGKTEHGMVYCVEVSVCSDVAKQYPLSVEAARGQLVYRSPVSVTQTDYTAQCQNAKSAGVQALSVVLDGSAIARLARSCAALGYHPQFVIAGGLVSAAQAEDPGIRANTMATASANAPWMRTDTPGQQEFAGAMARYAPGVPPDGLSMLGWAAGKLFEAAVARLGEAARSSPITAPAILTGLGKVRNETLAGLSPPITFTPGQRAAPQIHCVYVELLTAKGWTAPKGSTPICTRG